MAVAAEPPGCTSDTRKIGSTRNERTRSKPTQAPSAVRRYHLPEKHLRDACSCRRGEQKRWRQRVEARCRRAARSFVLLLPPQQITDGGPEVDHLRLVDVCRAAARRTRAERCERWWRWCWRRWRRATWIRQKDEKERAQKKNETHHKIDRCVCLKKTHISSSHNEVTSISITSWPAEQKSSLRCRRLTLS